MGGGVVRNCSLISVIEPVGVGVKNVVTSYTMRPSVAKHLVIGDVVTRNHSGQISKATPEDIPIGYIVQIIPAQWDEDWYDMYEREFSAAHIGAAT